MAEKWYGDARRLNSRMMSARKTVSIVLKNGKIGQEILAEREGFEPSVQVLARTTV
jgi:hypothetical protein